MYNYVQIVGGEEVWRCVPVGQIEAFKAEHKPMFVTVLAVNKIVESLTPDEKTKLAYWGPYNVDFDGPDIAVVIKQVHAFMDKLEALKLDLNMATWWATGSKGFHMELDPAVFMEKLPKPGDAVILPDVISKEPLGPVTRQSSGSSESQRAASPSSSRAIQSSSCASVSTASRDDSGK